MTIREEYLTVLSALYAAGKAAEAERILTTIARRGKTGRLFFEEFFIHLSLLLGVPRMIDGLELVARIFGERRTRTAGSPGNGLRVLRKVYGRQTDSLLKNLRSVHPELPGWVRRDVYGKVFARSGLSLQERELCNVVVLGIQGMERQLHSHIRGALRSGMSYRDLQSILACAARTLRRKTIPGFRTVRTVVSQMKKT